MHLKMSWNVRALLLCAPMISFSAPTLQSVYNAYWSNSQGFQSTAELHNNSVSKAITVTPILYGEDGSTVSLDDVTLQPLGNLSIDVNAQLAAKGLANWSWGTAKFNYSSNSPGALSAELYVSNAAESLSFTIPSIDKPVSSPAQHAVFWLSSRTTEVYAALQNISDAAINVQPMLSMYGVTIALTKMQIPPHGSCLLQLASDTVPDVLKAGWVKDAVGGLSVAHDGPAGALNTGGWVEDDSSGYSTTMTFQDPAEGKDRLLTTQVLVGQADSVLNMQGPFVISSQLVLRNISDQPLDFKGALTFSDSGNLANAVIQQMHLLPGEVNRIDLNLLKAQAGIPGSFVSASISLQHTGKNGALMGRVYGASADRQYGFYWSLQPFAANSYSESFWTTAESWVPILTVANFGASADNVTVELTYNGGTYKLPSLTLRASESYTLNVRDIIDLRTPDVNGKQLPPGISLGGYRIYGTSPKSQIVVKEHLIDPVAKLATPFYGVYVYAASLFFVPDNYPTWDPYTSVSYTIDTSGNQLGLTVQINFSDNNNGSDYGGVCPTGWDVWSGNNNINVSGTCPLGISGGQVGYASIAADNCCGLINDSSGDTGDVTTSNSAQVTITPSISWNGNYITNTDANNIAQNLVVGQQMFLNGNPSGGTWSVSPIAVGGFDLGPDNSSGQVETLFVTSNPDVLFYWVDQGNKTVSYTVSGIAATASFSVTGPTFNGINVVALGPDISSESAGPWLRLGYPPPNAPGISLSASIGSPSGYFGLASWTQIMNSTVVQAENSGGGYTVCSASAEVDNFYKYYGQSFVDYPGVLLANISYPGVEMSQSFTNYFMWDPNLSNSIAVPIAVVDWNWDGTASLVGSSWVAQGSAANVSYTSTTAFPSWMSKFTNGSFQNCTDVQGTASSFQQAHARSPAVSLRSNQRAEPKGIQYGRGHK